MNELTTVAAAFTVAPMANLTALPKDGFSTKNASMPALLAAFQASNALYSGTNNTYGSIDPTTEATINTLANIMDYCIDTSGETGSGSNCGNLYANTNFYFQPADTYQGILSIAQIPTNNVSTLFSYSGPTSPFQPSLTQLPSSFSLPIAGAPFISGVSPTSGPAGTSITISGSNLVSGTTTPIVVVNGLQATITGSPTSSSITVTVPSGTLTSGFIGVYTGTYASNFIRFAL